jgi:type III pantothenate kinase
MNLVIDYGNTSAKVGIFDKQVLVEKKTITSVTDLENLLTESTADNVIVSSVHHRSEDIISWASKAKRRYILDHNLPLPFRNLYRTPDTLGVDRIAGVCGALQLFPGSNTLSIDAGTCITYDFVDKEKRYLGGSISPGLGIRFRAVHEFTARLPLVEPVENPDFTGDTTETAIQSGIFYGMLAEIEGIIAQYNQKYRELIIVLTGGDACFFENKLKASIFASPNAVLIGLNSILNYNVNR